jgi:hypothetical protein
MMATNAEFDSHHVTPEGLYIRATITHGPHSGARVEFLIERTEAEGMGWIDPLEEEMTEEEKLPAPPKRKRSRKSAKAKLAEWNAMAKTATEAM